MTSWLGENDVAGLPRASNFDPEDTLSVAGTLEKLLLGWIQKKVGEGLHTLQKEPAWPDIQRAMDYVNGKQSPLRSKSIAKTSFNRLRKILLDNISALTDVRPIWNYETFNQQFKHQGEILSKLARAWWKNNFVDVKLQGTLEFAGVGGTGYAALVWDETLPSGGDFDLIPYDTRDVIPIDPVYGASIQTWGGVILRRRMPVEAIRQMYPAKADKITGTGGNWFGPAQVQQGSLGSLLSGVWTALTRGTEERTAHPGSKVTDFITIFVKDPALNLGDSPVPMGPPGVEWSYTVDPMQPLYPRGRLIVCTPDAILDDGPNPYWHGMFPIIKFTPDPLPWTLLGASMIGDLISAQDALNEGLRGLEDGMGQWVRRGVVADRAAIARSTLDQIDTRKSGMQVLLNPSAGDGFKVLDGPTFPDWYLQYLSLIVQQMDELSGTRGLQQLAQLKQMPSEGTMEKYMDALSPTVRLRARSIEISLGELAEQLKVGFFQKYDMKRRMQILGRDGASLEDFDFDPETLVPAGPGTRQERAAEHHKNFTFSVAPNSFLNVSHMTQKMMMLQLLRANLIDPWSAWDTFDLPEVGQRPAETIPERIIEARRMGLMPGPPPEVIQAQNTLLMAQAQAALGQMAAMMPLQQQAAAAQGGAPPQPGAPTSGVGPQGGRPPSGQSPPQFQTKDGGSRVVVSESGS